MTTPYHSLKTRGVVLILAAGALCLELAGGAGARVACAQGASPPLPPVHPRRNVDQFAPVTAKILRFNINKTTRLEPCIDELEVYAAGTGRNVALASAGAKVSGSGSLPGYQIHRLENINDGLYGNGRSWISSEAGRGWVAIEFPEVVTIDRVVWGRDREGKFIDRLVTEYEIEVALDPSGPWQRVASSANRQSLKTGAEFLGVNPAARQAITRFAPVGTTLGPETRAAPPEYIVDAWQSENGLPSNTISSILQTSDGYLWIGTFHGLVRFDGVRFRTFGEADGLPNNPISCLHQAKSGDLWIGTEGGGVIRFHQGGFTSITMANGLAHNTVLALEEDASGRIWIGTAAGLCSWFNGATRNPAGTGLDVLKLRNDPGGNLWALSSGGLGVMKDGHRLPPPIQGEPSRFTSLFALSRGPSGDLWFGGANGYIARWHKGELSVFGKDTGLVPDDIWELCEARNGDLWIGTASGGLSRLRNGRFTTFTTVDGLSSNSIRAILEDREGNLWVGSNGGGLMRLKPRRVITYTTRDGLSHEVIMSLAQEKDGRFWIGSNCGGLNTWQDEKPAPAYLNYLLDNACIWSLLPSANGSLWIGTWGQGLFEKRPEGIVNYLPKDGLSDDVVLALCEDRTGGLWIGTYKGGLNYFKDHVFRKFGTTNGLSSNFITSIVEDRVGGVWIGTSGGGLNHFDHLQFQAFTRREGLGSDFIRTLYQDSDGTLWIGTGGGGLSRLKDHTFRTATVRHGLKDDVISQILDDEAGNLWFGSNQGIFRVAKTNLHAVLDGRAALLNPVAYGKGEGMESLECTGGFHPAGLRSQDGKLWFSTVKGLVRIEPASAPGQSNPPPVVIEELITDGKSAWDAANVGRAASESPPRIRPGVRRLEFRFTALSMAAPERIRFRYRLENFERFWTEAGTLRSAQYSRLAPGEYRFRVRAANADGIWNETGAVLPFVVLPAFWQTWWFLLAVMLVVLILITLLIRYISVKKLRARLEKLEQQHALERERARIAQDIHDDIGATLTQIAFLSDLGQKKIARAADAEARFYQISRTTREVVRSLDQIVWAVNPRNDSLDHLANYLSHFAQEFLGSTSIRCRLEMPDQLPPVSLSAEERHNLFLAAREAIHNAAKHSGATEIQIRLQIYSSEFVIEVQDNGCGFEPEQVAEIGNGLRNIRGRLSEIGGEVQMTSLKGEGTRIVLRVCYESGTGRLARGIKPAVGRAEAAAAQKNGSDEFRN